jgi:hypothetical protein
MQLLKQDRQEPNCFACSAVMVIRHMLQIEQSPWLSVANLEALYEFIGHRGQEILWPLCIGDHKLKGIHHQEIIDWYIENFGHTLYLYECFPRSAPRGYEKEAIMIYDGEKAYSRFWNHLRNRPGILIMNTHAIAWDGHSGYDPNGVIRKQKDLENLIIEAWLIVSL